MNPFAQATTAVLQRPRYASPFLEEELVELGLDEQTAERVRFYREHGYLVLDGWFEPDLLDRIVAETKPLFQPDVAAGPRSRGRVQDGWRESPAVRALATDRRTLDLLAALYGRQAFAFQTLNFQFGTEQRGHQDRFHFSTIPSDFMCGVWVALEDVTLDNGALFYYPGSHRLPEWSYDDLRVGFRNPTSLRPFSYDLARNGQEAFLEHELATAGYERTVFPAKRGSLLIWAAGLVHGGSPILRPGSTRWSQVTHYFFHDCLYYTPMLSNAWIGDLYLRRVLDVATGGPVPNCYYGIEVEGIEEDYLYKLVLGDWHGREHVRAIRSYAVTESVGSDGDLGRQIEVIRSSNAYKIGRAVTAPVRAVKRLFGLPSS